MNTVHFDWKKACEEGTLEDHFRIALIDVNATSYALCSPAVKLFYQELHEYDDSWIVERVFVPATNRDEAILKESGVCPVASESHIPVSAFDVLCFSQQLIGDEVNLIGILVDADIPVRNLERKETDPIVIRGGASSYNPTVIKDVCDLFFIGEGEDILPLLLSTMEEGRKAGQTREEIILKAAQTWDCLWVPRFYQQRFLDNGCLAGMFRLREDVPEKIHYAYVQDLDQSFILTKPIGIRWMEGAVSPLSMSYQIPCPEGTNEIKLQKTIDTIMESDAWNYMVEYHRDGRSWQTEKDLRADILQLFIKEHKICMKLNPLASPYIIYQALLNIPWEIAGKYRAERTDVTFS